MNNSLLYIGFLAIYLTFARILEAALSMQRMFFVPGYAAKKREGNCSFYVSDCVKGQEKGMSRGTALSKSFLVKR
jgi:hypothetical protein